METELDALKNYDLSEYTTLKIGGKADMAFLPTSIDDFIEMVKDLMFKNSEFHIIGAGSNLLLSSNGVEGACILTKNLKNIYLIDDNRIYADCGLKSSSFSKFACEHKLACGEFLIGIPGSIGGAVYMNAGAHGQNIKDIIESVRVLDLNTLAVKTLNANELSFNYRSSTFMENNYIILSAIFNMPIGEENNIREKMDFHVNYRAEHHPPLTEYSAGSTFRNPKDDYAANLLESVGAKEYIENNKIRFSLKHANFLYNFNNATSTDAINLMYKMWERVNKKFGVKLHPEIRFIGRKTKEEELIWKTMTEL